jgi:hypothetical protein
MPTDDFKALRPRLLCAICFGKGRTPLAAFTGGKCKWCFGTGYAHRPAIDAERAKGKDG